MLTASNALTNQVRPGPRLMESLPPPPAPAAAVVPLLQLAPVQDPESATRARAECPQSCSTVGPALTAPTSYETATSKGQKSFLWGMCVVQNERGLGMKYKSCI